MTAVTEIGSLLDGDPTYWDSRPFIRGKRVTVQRVGIDWRQGATPEEIAEDRRLELAEVFAALAYYVLHREAIDADIEAYDAETERIAASWPSVATEPRPKRPASVSGLRLRPSPHAHPVRPRPPSGASTRS
jgi:uncharacterized protein (DUF433 family)